MTFPISTRIISALLLIGGTSGAQEGIHTVANSSLRFPDSWDVSRKHGESEILIAKSPDPEVDRRILIAVTDMRARYRVNVAQAVGSEMGARMMQNRGNGWALRTRGVYRSKTGLPVGRFDYQAGQPLVRYGYLIVQTEDLRFLEIEVFSRRPFSEWQVIDDIVSDLVDSVQGPGSTGSR